MAVLAGKGKNMVMHTATHSPALLQLLSDLKVGKREVFFLPSPLRQSTNRKPHQTNTAHQEIPAIPAARATLLLCQKPLQRKKIPTY